MSLDQPQRPEEDAGRQILRQGVVSNSPIDKPIGPSEVSVVEGPEGFRVIPDSVRKFPIFTTPRRWLGLTALAHTSPPPHGLDYARSAKDGVRHPTDQIQLGPLLILRQVVSLHRRGEAALGADREPLPGNDAGGVGDAPPKLVLVFQSWPLGRHQPQDDNPVGRNLA